MATLDRLFESSTFDVFVPALQTYQEKGCPPLDDLLLAHELDYALFDEKLTVYVTGRVPIQETALEGDVTEENVTAPLAVRSLFESLTIRLDATVVEPMAPSSPLFSPSDSIMSSGSQHGVSPGRPVSLLPPTAGAGAATAGGSNGGGSNGPSSSTSTLRPDVSTPTLQPPSPLPSTPASPVLGPNGVPRTIPRRSSSIRNVSLSPGLGPRRNSEMKQLSEGWAGTLIYEEKRRVQDTDISGDIQRYNEQWGVVFRFTVPITYIKLGDRSRTLLITAHITKPKSRNPNNDKDVSIMAESTMLVTGEEGETPSTIITSSGKIVDEPLSESPRRGSLASIISTTGDLPEPATEDAPLINNVPASTPVSRSTSAVNATNDAIMKKSATKTMPIRSTVNTVAKVTWTSLLENTLILAIDLENDVNAPHNVMLNKLDVEIVSAVLRPCGPSFEQAVHLLPGDQYTQLYHLTILDDDRKPPIQPPPAQVMVPSFARPGPDGELPQLFTPAQMESKLREVRLQMACTVRANNEDNIDREVLSDWRFHVDSSDAAKRRVQEQFRSGGARTVRVFPPSESIATTPSGPRPSRGGGPTASGTNTPTGPPATSTNVGRPMLTTAATGGGMNEMKGRGRRAFTLDRTGEDSSFGGPGLVISFSVNGPVVYEQEFVVEAFLVNRSHRTKNFTVLIPSRQSVAANTQRYRRPTLLTETRGAGIHVDTHMRGDTIIEKQRRSLQNHASLVCLDNHIRLSPLQPGACLSVYLHFIPFREHFNTIELVQLFDKDTGSMTSLRDVLDVYVQPRT